jgi:2-polyprenyl-6-methoxyphenol hydroxylase-like FAD-dependent oxidoreductase
VTRILIIGGGIAGLATALAATKAGLDATVYEAHPRADTDIGAFLTLASNGMLALAQIDAAESVARVGFDLTAMRVLSDTGTELAAVPLGDHSDPLARYRCLRRADLSAALRAEAASRGITVRHGKRLATRTEDGTGITAHFTDGDTARGDLLIGADGLNSTVRTLLDPTAPTPRYAGQRVFYGYSTDARPPHVPARIEMLRGSTAAFGYTVSPDGETYWFARVPDRELSAQEIIDGTADRWREMLVAVLRKDITPAAGIVAATGEQLMATNARDLPVGMRWHRGRTLLIGDAAHAASPATGQGAAMALEDAVVLAKALRDNGTMAAAWQVYDRLRRSRVEGNIVNSARLTANLPTGQVPPSRQPATSQNDELLSQLDWDLPIPA